MRPHRFGRPWRHRLELKDIWDDDLMPFVAKRDEIVRRITVAEFYDPEDLTLLDIVEDLATAEDEASWNWSWAEFYDWCDEDKRVWVNII